MEMRECGAVRDDLTAWLDGELQGEANERVARHLRACTDCDAEAQSLGRAVAWQQQALAQLAVADVDASRLRRQLRRALEAELPASEPWYRWLLQPTVLAATAFAAAGAVLVVFVGGPKPVLISVGVSSPPPAVVRAPGLFKDYGLLEHLDALENFDTVDSVPLDDDQNGRG